MDQIKIGKFIAELRKKENLTQFELAERLGITDRAVSKWERGLALPDASIMLELCKILKITVHDLLCFRTCSFTSSSLSSRWKQTRSWVRQIRPMGVDWKIRRAAR